jgi:hypothetical protein
VVALHAYTADADGELTLEKGDEITVTDEGDNSGWWKGDAPSAFLRFFGSMQSIRDLDMLNVGKMQC